MPQMVVCENCHCKYNPAVTLSCPMCFWGAGFSTKRPDNKPKPLIENIDKTPEIKLPIETIKPPAQNPPGSGQHKSEIRAKVYKYLQSEGFEMTSDRRKKLKAILKEF